MAKIKVNGRLIGLRYHPGTRKVRGEIVHILKETRPTGPAANAYVYVDMPAEGLRRARYISWINLYDIEHANRKEPNCWVTVEPAQTYSQAGIAWQPFGWDTRELPSVADTH